jgi:hypothetical protein
MEAQYLNISQSMLNEIMDKWNFLTVLFWNSSWKWLRTRKMESKRKRNGLLTRKIQKEEIESYVNSVDVNNRKVFLDIIHISCSL